MPTLRPSHRATALASMLWVASLTIVQAEPTYFEQHVRPILKANCFHCHGEEPELAGSLDLRLVRLMRQGGDSGPAIAPGDPASSLLLQRVAAGEMPPGDKHLSAAELSVLENWLAEGALTARPEPETAPTPGEFTDEERHYWAFQPVTRPTPPAVSREDLVRTPVDRFLLAQLEQHGLTYSPEADRATLIRRLYFDLLGLPPTVEAVDRFLSDERPDAYEQLVEELLASPHYGERWARHWLDAAGYADSDGYSTQDTPRLHAYRFRDYVIRSLNDDKPWDQFIVEQLAGDELLPQPLGDLSPEAAEKLVATGFLRMAPDGTSDPSQNVPTAREEVIAETIKIVSSSLLGLTVGCAQCHDHRYDPIAQADYYQFRAVFEPAFDPQNWRVPAARLVSLWSAAEREQAAAIDTEVSKLNEQRTAEILQLVEEVFAREVAALPAEQQELARTTRSTPADQRTPEQQQLFKDHPTLNVDGGSVYLYEPARVQEIQKKYDDLVAAQTQQRPADAQAHCLTEAPGTLPPTHLYYRGDIGQPREVVPPTDLAIVRASYPGDLPNDDESLPTSGRRLALARRLTSGQHPLVTRVLMNRVWMLHFGRGLVSTPGDFGSLGSRPTHPELLDYLASEFVASGWHLKQMHRLLVNSTAYRQVSQRTEALDAVDPDNLLLGRMNLRRLEAEAVRDAVLACSGQLNTEMFGPPVPVTYDDVGQVIVGRDTRDSAGRPSGESQSLGAAEFRRSVYVQVRRSMPLSMLETFDAPELRPNCMVRNVSTVAPQALLLMNSAFVLQRAADLAQHVAANGGSTPEDRVRLAWRIALAREPDADSLAAGVEFLSAQAADFAAQQAVEGAPTAEDRALASYCQALFSSNLFLYVE